jgi:hypothetical protein
MNLLLFLIVAVLPDYLDAQYTSPPFYPSPYGGTLSQWSSAYQQASAKISQMTLSEKVNLTSGSGSQMVSPFIGNYNK